MRLNKAIRYEEGVDGCEIYIMTVRTGARDQECWELVTTLASAPFKTVSDCKKKTGTGV